MVDWRAALHASTSTPIMRLEAEKVQNGAWRVMVQAGSDHLWWMCDAYTSRPNVNQPAAITADDAIAECMFLLTRKIRDWQIREAKAEVEASGEAAA